MTYAQAWTLARLIWREPLILFLLWLGLMAELADGETAA